MRDKICARIVAVDASAEAHHAIDKQRESIIELIDQISEETSGGKFLTALYLDVARKEDKLQEKETMATERLVSIYQDLHNNAVCDLNDVVKMAVKNKSKLEPRTPVTYDCLVPEVRKFMQENKSEGALDFLDNFPLDAGEDRS